MAQLTNLGLHWTSLNHIEIMIYNDIYIYIYIFIFIFILWNSPQMVSSGMVYYWVYHIRNFVLRNFCHLSSSHGPGLVTRPICTSRVWSMLVTAWPWHVGTSMWLTKSAAPMVTRKCWLYLLVSRPVAGICYDLKCSEGPAYWSSFAYQITYQRGKSTRPSTLRFLNACHIRRHC